MMWTESLVNLCKPRSRTVWALAGVWLAFALSVVLFAAGTAAAAGTPGCDTVQPANAGGAIGVPIRHFAQAATPPATPPADNTKLVPAPCPDDCPKAQCIINDYINPIIKALIATTSVVIVFSIVRGGIQYSAAGGDSGKLSAAKDTITKAIIALIMFLLLYAGLNYLIPGGV